MHWGGWNQVPSDPAQRNAQGQLEHGTFQTAIDLYVDAYDVHMYDEEEVGLLGGGDPYEEVVSAVQNRGVTSVAIFGYSWGGGATEDLAGGLDSNRATIGTFQIRFTAYIDAVESTSSNEENDRPLGSAMHLTIYQDNGNLELGGGPVTPTQPADPPAINVSNTGWGAGLDHYLIDDHPNVRDAVRQGVQNNVTR